MGWPPKWVGERLIVWASEQWPEFDGWCASRNVEPLLLPYDRLLNLIYFYLINGAGRDDRERLDQLLHERPPGVTSGEQYDPDRAGADFMQALAQSGT